jgi:hypothetical protein
MNKTMTCKIFDDACRNESIEILLLSVLVNEQISPAKVVVQVDLNVDEQSQSGLDLLGIGWAEPFSQTARPHSSSPAPFCLHRVQRRQRRPDQDTKYEERRTRNEDEPFPTHHPEDFVINRVRSSTDSRV